MATVMGAPNVVRGGSHSGNARRGDFAEAGLARHPLFRLCAGALLMAAFHLADAANVGGLAGATRMVTKNPARRRD